MSEKKSFWSTIPGTIAAVAAMVTAVAGAVPVINAVRSDDQPAATASPSPSAYETDGTGASSGGDPNLVPSPKALLFGRLVLGSSSAALPVELVNTGTGAVTLERLRIVGPDSEAFTIVGTTCTDGIELEPEASCDIEVQFSPTGGGERAATLLVEPEEESALEVPLSGATGLL
jgi:hypothetical protein